MHVGSQFACVGLPLPLSVSRVDGPLPTGRFMSYFSVMKTVFESVNDRKGELTKVNIFVTPCHQHCAHTVYLVDRFINLACFKTILTTYTLYMSAR